MIACPCFDQAGPLARALRSSAVASNLFAGNVDKMAHQGVVIEDGRGMQDVQCAERGKGRHCELGSLTAV